MTDDYEDHAPVTPKLREIATRAIEQPEMDNDRGSELSRDAIVSLYYASEARDSHSLTWEENRTVGALIAGARIVAEIPHSLVPEGDGHRSAEKAPVEETARETRSETDVQVATVPDTSGNEMTDEQYHEEEIQHRRAVFNAALVSAEDGIAQTVRALQALIDHRVYDVEYAEGQASEDMAAFLADAARMIRAAKALNPRPTT